MKIRRTLCLTLLIALFAPISLHAQDEPTQPRLPRQRSIEITATDRVLNEADVATVHIGYQIFAPDKDTAYTQASQASNAIINALRNAGIAKDAIESQQQSVAPTEPYQLNQMKESDRAGHAFTASQSWTVRASAADASRVLDLSIKAGANNSGEIDWSLHDPNAASTQAAAKALQRARAQAEAMASGLGVHLGQLLFASNEVEAQPIRPVMAMVLAARAKAPSSVPPLAINPRQIETSATVRAVFAIE